MTTQAPTGQADGAKALIARLRAEYAAQEDKTLKALLLHECGVLEELSSEEAASARDYLAAFNADPLFREPLEALIRILTRRKSIKNLGKLLDALTRAAQAPEERARAFWERAAYLQDYEQNLPAAKESLEEAVAANPEDPAPWLELELIAARDGDVQARMRALEARAELATEPLWKAVLLIELAELAVKSEAYARAYDLLDAAGALEGNARFRTRVALEAAAVKEDNPEVLARALEGQADLIAEAISEPATGDASGVPRFMRKAEYAADAWVRAAEIRRKTGDTAGWSALLVRAAETLPDAPVLARARMSALEMVGDADGAAALAKRELDRGASGPGAAALWLRLAEASALGNDREAALRALRGALTVDPECVPARALELDLLGDGQDPAALAGALEAAAEAFPTEEAKGRAYLLAAYVWASQGEDVGAAKVALSQAGAAGVPPGVVSRVARTLASLRGDAAWYEEATKRLLAAGSEASEQASLWFELGRSRLLRGDDAGATEAFSKLATIDASSAWLGRILGAYAVGLKPPEDADAAARLRSPDAIEELAKVEPDRDMARALTLVAALRAARGGDASRARSMLRELHEMAPEDEVTAVLVAELDRRAGDASQAAQVLTACAAAVDEEELAAALHLEAALVLWRGGDRVRALQELETARDSAPKAAATLLNWALRGADPDTLKGRRRALESAADAGGDRASVAFERFALEVAWAGSGGDVDQALSALELVEEEGYEDLAVAAAIGRLAVPMALSNGQSADRALDRLEQHGGDARTIARAERYRLARVDRDGLGGLERALEAAAEWVRAEPSLPATLEWMAAASAASDREAEAAARRQAASHFDDEARAAIEASAAISAKLEEPTAAVPFVGGESAPAQLVNLELALPGTDPRRRAAALFGLDGALGPEAELDAIALAGWSALAAGAPEEALKAFRAVVENRADDLAAWEGVRTASLALEDYVSAALAAAQLGSLCRDDARGGEFWEIAGLLLLEKTDAHEDAEIAFERAFERNPRRAVAFDKLFRAVRARNEDDRLLEIIARRLQVAEDDTEIAKMFWERARVLRKKGDREGALSALENVTMLEPDHVGALALAGEIQITKGVFDQAAPLLAKLSTIAEAPQQQRLVSGIAAVDLYENKLGQVDKALEVLVGLHRANLSTPPVRERLARLAAKAGSWREATTILEQLMNERDKPEGRIEAARLSMAIWRDKLNEPLRAEGAVARLLDEVPDDGEALDLVLTTNYGASFRTRVIGRAKATLVHELQSAPIDANRVTLLAKIAGAGQDAGLRQATLGALVALGRDDPGLSEELTRIDMRVPARPQIALDVQAMSEIADPLDNGPIAELFAAMAETICAALGPSLDSLGVTKRDRIDPRGGPPLRLAVAEWMGALGFEGDFDLYCGGRDPRGCYGVAGEQPAIVIGSQITVPLTAASRSAIAREVFALRRGITSVRTRDDNTIASLVIAACNESGFAVPHPGYAVFGEIQRAIHKEISRKVRKAILEPCQRIAAGGTEPTSWAAAARRSIDRMAVIAAGDVSLVLADVLAAPREQLGFLVPESDRARRLLAFVLSPNYLELRRKLGMGVR